MEKIKSQSKIAVSERWDGIEKTYIFWDEVWAWKQGAEFGYSLASQSCSKYKEALEKIAHLLDLYPFEVKVPAIKHIASEALNL